jgi:hypothetical protein
MKEDFCLGVEVSPSAAHRVFEAEDHQAARKLNRCHCLPLNSVFHSSSLFREQLNRHLCSDHRGNVSVWMQYEEGSEENTFLRAVPECSLFRNTLSVPKETGRQKSCARADLARAGSLRACLVPGKQQTKTRATWRSDVQTVTWISQITHGFQGTRR